MFAIIKKKCYLSSLNEALSKSSLGLESDIHLMFFHPRFAFRNGEDIIVSNTVNSENGRPLSNSASCSHFSRRSPWPMICIKRASQMQRLQQVMPSGVVLQRNEASLRQIGAETLQV